MNLRLWLRDILPISKKQKERNLRKKPAFYEMEYSEYYKIQHEADFFYLETFIKNNGINYDKQRRN